MGHVVSSTGTHTLEIDDTWEVVYTLGADDGQPVVREMQIRPQRGKPLPAGGLSTRAVRQIKLGEHLAIIRTRLAQGLSQGRSFADRTTEVPGVYRVSESAADFLRDAAERVGVTSVQGGKRLGRPSQPDTYYATMALAYVDALKQGSRRPVADVAKAENYSPSHVRDALKTARERGLLTRPKGRGRADGKLTEKAIGLLRAPDSTKVTSTPTADRRPPWWLRRPGDQA